MAKLLWNETKMGGGILSKAKRMIFPEKEFVHIGNPEYTMHVRYPARGSGSDDCYLILFHKDDIVRDGTISLPNLETVQNAFGEYLVTKNA